MTDLFSNTSATEEILEAVTEHFNLVMALKSIVYALYGVDQDEAIREAKPIVDKFFELEAE